MTLKSVTVIVTEGKYNNVGSYWEGAHCVASTLVGQRLDGSEIWIQVYECASSVTLESWARARDVTIISNREYSKEEKDMAQLRSCTGA
jgi:hypothetical protein